MARPSRDTIQSGVNGWDSTVNDNFIKIWDRPITIHEHTGDESDLAATFPAASYQNCLVWVDHTVDGWTFYLSDGATWGKFSAGLGFTFLDLSDTPSSFSGETLKYVRVNAGETALEFVTFPIDTFLDLSDTPANYTSAANKFVKVNGAGNALEYVAAVDTQLQSFVVAASDEITSITATGTKVTFRMPYAFTITDVRCSLSSACTTGTFTVDINESGSTILSTKLTIDATEKTSETAAIAAVVSDSSLADDAEITIDVDNVGDSTGQGLKVVIIGRPT